MKKLERDIEAYLVNRIHKWDGVCWKFTSPGTRGVPDRYCAVLGNQFFVELKRPHHKKRPDEKLQQARHKELANQGVKTYVLETTQDIDLLFRYLKAGILPEVNYFARL